MILGCLDQWCANPGTSNPNPPCFPWIRIRIHPFSLESESESSWSESESGFESSRSLLMDGIIACIVILNWKYFISYQWLSITYIGYQDKGPSMNVKAIVGGEPKLIKKTKNAIAPLIIVRFLTQNLLEHPAPLIGTIWYCVWGGNNWTGVTLGRARNYYSNLGFHSENLPQNLDFPSYFSLSCHKTQV